MTKRTLDRGILETVGEQLAVPASNATANNITVFATRWGFGGLVIEPAAALRWQLTPKIHSIFLYDVSAAVGSRWKNLQGNANGLLDRHVAGDTSTLLDSMQTGDKIYIGTQRPHGGFSVDMDASAVNGNASTLTLKYSKSDNTFASQAITDGTITVATKTLSGDGNITLDAIPTDWVEDDLKVLTGLTQMDLPNRRLYWVELSISAALSADVEIEKVISMSQRASGATLGGGYMKANVEYTLNFSDDAGGLQLMAQAASSTTANVSWLKRDPE